MPRRSHPRLTSSGGIVRSRKADLPRCFCVIETGFGGSLCRYRILCAQAPRTGWESSVVFTSTVEARQTLEVIR